MPRGRARSALTPANTKAPAARGGRGLPGPSFEGRYIAGVVKPSVTGSAFS